MPSVTEGVMASRYGAPVAGRVPEGVTDLLKRIFDASLASTGLLLSAPLWAVFAAAIKLEDGGMVFYGQERVGQGGRTFFVWKFRSMVPNAEAAVGPMQASVDDPRITRVGHWLRATAMDELPQLWNIVCGDMSFVGPRALRPGEIEVQGDGRVERLEEVSRVRPALPGATGTHRHRPDLRAPGSPAPAQVPLRRAVPPSSELRRWICGSSCSRSGSRSAAAGNLATRSSSVTLTSTSRILRKFVATLFAASPRTLVLAAVVMVGLSFTEGLGLLLLVPLLQLVGVDGHAIVDPGGIGAVLTRILASIGLRPTLGVVLAIYVGLVVGQSVLQRWNTMLSAAVRQQAEAMLRMRLYRAIGRAQWLFVARNRLADFAHVLTSELDRVGTAAHDLIDLSVVTLVAIVYIVVALYVSPAATALVLLCGGALALILRGRVADSHQLGGEQSASRAHLHRAITEHLGSMKIAKSYGAVDRHDEVFGRLTEQVQHVNLRTIAGYARLRQETIVGSAVVLAMIVYVARQLLALPTAHLLVLLFLFARLMPRLTGLFERAQTFATVLPAFRAFDDLESQCLASAEPADGAARPIAFDREIRFDRVSFSYSANPEAPALTDISLRIPAGSMTAIVGASGAGKSTIADLLLGLIVPSRGSVLIDAEVLDSSRVSAWRGQIGYVNQETFLFHDTVRANLLWARPGASEHELQHVLRLAAADEFVERLPAGLETIMGDRGVLVSGGERQRLALARALLRQPRLLILDEATNALDSDNEGRIRHAIDGLRHRMTIVLITHRLSTVKAADRIYVLDQGRLVESGSWSDLISLPGGRFANLCLVQEVDAPMPPRPRPEPVSFVRL